uniref:Uncharacterized protein n=1 Tax=Marmota marmota marmota TaxID=9994 RepID=A0A8C5ZRU9_MARMA
MKRFLLATIATISGAGAAAREAAVTSPIPIPILTVVAPPPWDGGVSDGSEGSWVKQITCNYSMHGFVKKDIIVPTSMITLIVHMVCKHFQQECYIYEDHYRYEHRELLKQASKPTKQTSKTTKPFLPQVSQPWWSMSTALGSSLTAAIPTFSSVFTSEEVLSTLRARS